uniref:Uncharacterized protein n=1 Tax=Siphoviridae sp. ctAjZ17 TaxID=2827797 RepID=A0A8S5SNF3_9CAUD|nr:MAG TPA: hypothetical protein [Siphoviridae sp. ctAjZ17]
MYSPLLGYIMLCGCTGLIVTLGFSLIWYIARKELPRGNNFKRVFCEIMKGWLLLRYITFADLCDFTLVLCAVASLVCLILKK